MAMRANAFLQARELFRVTGRGLVHVADMRMNDTGASLIGFVGLFNLFFDRDWHCGIVFLAGQGTRDGNTDDTGFLHGHSHL